MSSIAEFKEQAKSRLNAEIVAIQKREAAWQQRCIDMLCHLAETANRPITVENLLLADRYLNNTFGGLTVEALTQFAQYAKAQGLIDMEECDRGWQVYRSRQPKDA